MLGGKKPKFKTMLEVAVEVSRARWIHGTKGNSHLLAALMEEVGELAKSLLEGEASCRVREEAKHVACVAIRIMEEGEGSFDVL